MADRGECDIGWPLTSVAYKNIYKNAEEITKIISSLINTLNEHKLYAVFFLLAMSYQP
jgi:hypothetical protein